MLVTMVMVVCVADGGGGGEWLEIDFTGISNRSNFREEIPSHIDLVHEISK